MAERVTDIHLYFQRHESMKPLRNLRWLGLGSVEIVSLADARKLARDFRRMVRVKRRDPIDERQATRAQAARAKATEMTFAQCCDAYLAQHSEGWKNDKHRPQWRSTLNRACEAFGKLPVAHVSTTSLMRPATANHPSTD